MNAHQTETPAASSTSGNYFSKMGEGAREIWSGVMKLSGMYMFGLAQSNAEVETEVEVANQN